MQDTCIYLFGQYFNEYGLLLVIVTGLSLATVITVWLCLKTLKVQKEAIDHVSRVRQVHSAFLKEKRNQLPFK